MEKDLNIEFYNSKSTKNKKTCWCKDCMSTFRESRSLIQKEYMRVLRKEKPEEVKAARRKSWHRDPKRKIFQSAKSRALRRGIEFSIDLTDIILPDLCPILGVPFIQGTKSSYEQVHSIDRVDNTKGYIKGNIQIISKKANSMKNSGTPEELLKLADWIYKTFK